ncbi:hypothetical protein Aperf_G00000083945 [Anoplocephala perfoliata]
MQRSARVLFLFSLRESLDDGEIFTRSADALLSTLTLSAGLDQREEEKTELQVETRPGATESCRNTTKCTESRLRTCHHALSCLISAGIWIGFLAAFVLILIGIWTRYRNCLTIGVILAIVCLGVAIHNCLQRGDSIPNIPIYIRKDRQFASSCDDLDIVELETNTTKAEADAEVASKCGSANGIASIHNQDASGGSDPVFKCSHKPNDVEAACIRSTRPRIRRDSTIHSLTRAIITTLTRAGRGSGGGGSAGCGGGGVSSYHVPRNAWNSNFEGHIGWQSARARPDPFYSNSLYR